MAQVRCDLMHADAPEMASYMLLTRMEVSPSTSILVDVTRICRQLQAAWQTL